MHQQSRETYTLNVIRAGAAQMVVIGHSFGFAGASKHVGYMASLGVVIFFLISGYLITGSAQRARNNGYGFKHYFINRFARIYSAFVPALVVIAALDLYYVNAFGWSSHVNAATISIKHFVANIFMLQNAPAMNGLMNQLPFGSKQFGSGRPLWTLSFEWWLYMSFGLVFFFREKLFEWKWLVLFGIVAYVPISNLMSLSKYAGGLTAVWLAGSALWLSRPKWHYVEENWALLIAFWAGALATVDFLVGSTKGKAFNVYDLNFIILLSVTLCAVIIWASKEAVSISRRSNGLAALLANYSYTLYLIHYSIIYLILQITSGLPIMIVIALSIIVPNVVAILLARVTEAKHRQFAMFLRARFN